MARMLPAWSLLPSRSPATMSLSTRHRASIYQSLVPVLGEEEAGALLHQFPAAEHDELVTRQFLRAELAEFRVELKGEMGELKAEMGELRAELKGEMGELRAELKGEMGELKAEMGELRAELKGDIEGLRGELHDEVSGLRTEMKTQHVELRSEMVECLNRNLVVMNTMLVAGLTIGMGAAAGIATVIAG
jgi:hypothetical protein